MTYPNRPAPPDRDILALFPAEIARAARLSGLPYSGVELWPCFAGYYRALARLPRKARRALQRHWRRSLGGIAVLCALGQAPALAATLDVDGTSCTLVDAISAANNDAPAGGCPAGSGADILVLPPGSTHTLATPNDTNRYTGLPGISSIITIQGNGSTIRRDPGAPQFRILEVATDGDLTLQETTVSGGASNQEGVSGGGALNRGTLALMNSTVSGNSGGSYGGGGVSNLRGLLKLTNSTVSGNSAGSGGGLFNDDGLVTLTNSTVSGNSADDGGGLDNRDGLVTLTNSTVSGNSAGSGGGVRNSRFLVLAQTLVSGNTASTQGPEVFSVDPEYGASAVIADNLNLIGHDGVAGTTGFVPGPTDFVPAGPLGAILDTALADNGGSTKTHALVAGSPALDAVREVFCGTSTDQRGVPRPQDGDGNRVPDCDIGAFELVVVPQASPVLGPPASPDAEPLVLSNPRPSGCTFSSGEITCPETGGTPSSIVFDTNIPGDARFLQFGFAFVGTDVQPLGSESPAASGRPADDPRLRASGGELGAVFVSNVPIAVLPASLALPQGAFSSSGQFPLAVSGATTLTVTNFPSGTPGSVFRVHNLRIDRCRERCFKQSATICGSNGPDTLTGTSGRDVIAGRGGDDTIRGLGGNDVVCGGPGRDKLSGGRGNDQLRGDPGRDKLDGGPGTDACVGGRGNDTASACEAQSGIP